MLTYSLFFQFFFLYFIFGTQAFNVDPNENEKILPRTTPLEWHTTFSWNHDKLHKKNSIIKTLLGFQRHQPNKTNPNSSRLLKLETNVFKKSFMSRRILESQSLHSLHNISPSLNITLHKLGSMFSLFLVGILGGSLAFFFQHKKNFYSVMTLVNSFSTGSFFGLMFFHLSPEITYISNKSNFGFSIRNQFYDMTSFCTFWGFFSVFVLEKVVSPCILSKTKQPQFLTHCHSIGPLIMDEENMTSKEQGNCHQTPQNKKVAAKIQLEVQTNKKEYNTQSKISVSETHHSIVLDRTPSTIVTDVPTTHSQEFKTSLKNPSTDILSPSFFVSFLICFALCFHSVTEGIIIGLLSDSISIWIATLSVCGHKCVASFSLAANCLRNQFKNNSSFLFLIVFSLSSPFGVLIGFLTYMPNSQIFVFINCISLGAIMYAACDMAFSEFHHFTQLNTELKKIACLLFGATIILFLTLLHYTAGSHNHQHYH